MPSSCINRCEVCAPSLSIFSILVTSNMPVEGFNSLVYDPNDTMPYKNYFYKDKGNSNSIFTVVKTTDCDRPSCPASCPPGGGWDCAGNAVGVRTQNYEAQGNSTSLMQVNITEKGNYRKEINTITSRNSNGANSVYGSSWTKSTQINNKYINGILDPSSKNYCAPEVLVPNPICGVDPITCKSSCTDYAYTQGGCSNSTSDIPWMPQPTCTTSKTKRKCNGNESISPNTSCPGDSYYRQGTISSEETVASQVTEAEILSMARQAATTKVNLKKQNQNTADGNQDITEDGSCCRFIGQCDGQDDVYPVDFISDCDGEYDDCSFTSFTKLPTTCNCSKDKDECWTGYSNITIPTEFSYTIVTIGAFKIATNINKEQFSKEYKNVSGTVYFYIDSESEPETSPCCTACGGIECFTGEIVGTSTYSISGTGFKQNTRVASNDLTYIYDSSELYAIHPGKVIKTCYTVDNLEFF